MLSHSAIKNKYQATDLSFFTVFFFKYLFYKITLEYDF